MKFNNKPKRYNFENVIIHCNTYDKLERILKLAHEQGYKWCNNKSFLEFNPWHKYKGNTVIFVYKGMFGTIKTVRGDKKLIEFNKFIKECLI